MPKLTRRSRILIAIALTIALLFLVSGPLVNTYVDWLWFGELGYRSVFSTVLVTKLVVFLVGGLVIGAVVFGALALAYRTRPVFVPTAGPNDPVARYRTAAMARLRLFGIGIPVVIGFFAGMVAQTYWVRVQMFLNGGSFGVNDPQFGMDLGFYAFDLPFYRLVLSYLFVGVFLAFVANLLGHYLFGGIRLAGRTGALSRSARIQLISLGGTLILLKAVAYWFDRYELLSHTRGGKPFTGAGYTDINAVLPAKLILLAIAVICAVAVFSAIVLRDLRIPAIGVVLLLLSSLIVGAGWPLVVEQISVKPNAAQKESDYISRSITATRDAYGLTAKNVTYRDYSGNSSTTAQQVAADRATTSNIRLLDPTIVAPAFTQFQQGKNFYSFPDQLSIDRYNGPDGDLRDYVVAARELNPDRLIDNQRDWINRHTVYTHGNGFIASPANTVRGVANDPNQNGGYPEFLASVVGANGTVVAPGPAPLFQPPNNYGPIIAGATDDYAIVGRNGTDREYDYETNTETKNYTYTGGGGVPIGNWLSRSVFAVKFAERNFLFSNVIGSNSKILFNRDPAKRVEAVAPWLTTDSSVYPAIVNKKMVWIVDGYTTLDNYPYSELTSLSSATADSSEVALNRLQLDGEAEERHLAGPRRAPALPGGPVQGAARAVGEVPRQRSGDVLLHVGLLGRAARPEPDGEQLSTAVLHRRQGHCAERQFGVIPVDQCDEPVPPGLPGGLHQRQFRPGHVRQDHGADHSGPGQRTQAGLQCHQYRHGRQPGPRCDRAGQPEPDPLGQPADPASGSGRPALRGAGVRLAGGQ
jgi:uncharacterized membrane protein (UPF0182 family)